LPQWRIRRIAYDDGEWHCALSRQRELPEWLDRSIEARHADLPLAMLTAHMEVLRQAQPPGLPGPSFPQRRPAPYECLRCENFS